MGQAPAKAAGNEAEDARLQKAQQEEEELMKMLEDEMAFLSNPNNISREGLLLTTVEEGYDVFGSTVPGLVRASSALSKGKIIFNLEQIPLKVPMKTRAGNFLLRTSKTEILVRGGGLKSRSFVINIAGSAGSLAALAASAKGQRRMVLNEMRSNKMIRTSLHDLTRISNLSRAKQLWKHAFDLGRDRLLRDAHDIEAEAEAQLRRLPKGRHEGLDLLRFPTPPNLTRLRDLLKQCTAEWLAEFIEQHGLDALVTVLQSCVARKKLDFYDVLRQVTAVQCLKAFMNNEQGLRAVIEGGRGSGNVVKLMVPILVASTNVAMVIQLLDTMAALCICSSEGYKLVRDAVLHAHEEVHLPASDSTPKQRKSVAMWLVDSLKPTSVKRLGVDFAVSAMAFLNAVVSTPVDAGERAAMRDRFLVHGLLAVLGSLKDMALAVAVGAGEDKDMAGAAKMDVVSMHIRVFEDMMNNDHRRLLGKTADLSSTSPSSLSAAASPASVSPALPSNPDDVDQLLAALKIHCSNSALFTPFLALLQRLLLIPADTTIGPACLDRIVRYVVEVASLKYSDDDLDHRFQQRIDDVMHALRSSGVTALYAAGGSGGSGRETARLREIVSQLKRKNEELEERLRGGVPPGPPSIGPAAGPIPPAPPAADSTASESAPTSTGPPPPPIGGGPPPPPIGGGPPPPPGMGRGMPNKKPKRMPKPKMKMFAWNKIPNQQIKGTAWEKDITDENVALHYEEVEQLFAAAVAKPKSETDSGEAASAGSEKKKPAKVILLDPRKSTNISLLLSQFKLPNEAIIASVAAMDEAVLTLDRAVALKKAMALKKEEISAVTAYDGDRTLLAGAEQFILAAAAVPRFMERLDILLFRQEFDVLWADAADGFERLIDACRQVRLAPKFRRLLEYVLALGNFLNAGAPGGANKTAYGFRLDSLLKLGDTKANVVEGAQGGTLLSYLIECLEKSNDETDRQVLNVVETDLARVEAASKIPFAQSLKIYGALQKRTNDMRPKVEALAADPATSSLQATLEAKDFIARAAKDIVRLERLIRDVFHEYHELSRYYAEEPLPPPDIPEGLLEAAVAAAAAEEAKAAAKAAGGAGGSGGGALPAPTPEEFFAGLFQFCVLFRKTREGLFKKREELVKKQLAEQRKKEAEEKRAAARAAKQAAAEAAAETAAKNSLLDDLADQFKFSPDFFRELGDSASPLEDGELAVVALQQQPQKSAKPAEKPPPSMASATKIHTAEDMRKRMLRAQSRRELRREKSLGDVPPVLVADPAGELDRAAVLASMRYSLPQMGDAVFQSEHVHAPAIVVHSVESTLEGSTTVQDVGYGET